MTHELPPRDPKALAEQIVNMERQASLCQQGAYGKLVEELNEVNKMGKGMSDNVFKIVAATDNHDGVLSMVAKGKDESLTINSPYKTEHAKQQAALGTWLEAHDAKIDADLWNNNLHVAPQLHEDFLKAYYQSGEAGVRKFAAEINGQNTTTAKFQVNSDHGVTKVMIVGPGLGVRELFNYSPDIVWHLEPQPLGRDTASPGAKAEAKQSKSEAAQPSPPASQFPQ